MGRVGYSRNVGSRMGIQPYPRVLSGTRCRRPLCQMQHAYPTSPPCLLASLALSHSLSANPIPHSLPSSTLSLKLPSLPHDSVVHLPVPLGDATAHRAPRIKAAVFDHRTTPPLRSRPVLGVVLFSNSLQDFGSILATRQIMICWYWSSLHSCACLLI